MFDLNVAIPATSKIPVLTFAVPTPVNADPSIAGSVPVKFAAVKLVKLAPLMAGNEPVKLLAGNVQSYEAAVIIPVVLTEALPLKPVAFPVTLPVTSPTKLVAVTIPVTSIPDSLDVTADPTDV